MCVPSIQNVNSNLPKNGGISNSDKEISIKKEGESKEESFEE